MWHVACPAMEAAYANRAASGHSCQTESTVNPEAASAIVRLGYWDDCVRWRGERVGRDRYGIGPHVDHVARRVLWRSGGRQDRHSLRELARYVCRGGCRSCSKFAAPHSESAGTAK